VVTTDLPPSDPARPGGGLRRLDVEAALGDVTRRLTGRFSPAVPEALVAATVREYAGRWQAAPVTDFVPLLVERRSIERLRRLLAGDLVAGDAALREDAGTTRARGYSQVA
jgi:hypothetical protein